MNRLKIAGFVALATALFATAAGATPATNVWNPSTDVQPVGTWHLGIDNYFSVRDNGVRAYAFPTDVGLTYGLIRGLEVGIDLLEPVSNPFLFHAKYGLPETAALPALAVGIQGVGTTRATQANIAYGLLSKTFGRAGRITAGGYHGSKSILGSDNTGAIVAWDRAFGEKWWGSVDYASGNNVYGALAFGVSRKFAPNVGLIVGYVLFNDEQSNRNDTVTTQLDIDF